MAKNVKNKKVEKSPLELSKELALRDLEEKIRFVNEPTRFFEIDEDVRYGAFSKAIVKESFKNGKAYLLLCTVHNNNYGKPYDTEEYRLAPWMNMLHRNNSGFISASSAIICPTFTKEVPVDIRFYTSTVESLLHKYYSFGVDMDPVYQRDYVWDNCDKEYLIDSIFNNADIGKFVFVIRDSNKWHEDYIQYEILDGKQRLSTLIEFYEDRLTYKGYKFSELCGKDKNAFMQHEITYGEIEGNNINGNKDILECFLRLNRGGKQMGMKQIEKVEKMLKEN